MPSRSTLASLALTATVALTGCASDETFHSIAHEGEEGPSWSTAAEQGSPDFTDYIVPVIESFRVEPLYLPLGGGEVEVSWSSSYAHGCAVLVDGESAAQGTEGEEIIAIEASSDIELVCIDEQHDDFTESVHSVVVQTPPVEDFDAGAPVLATTAWEEAAHEAKFYEASVIEYRISIDEESRVILTPGASPERSNVTVWLAQDFNQDGFVDSDEVIAIARSSNQQVIDVELDEGDYSLFMEADDQAEVWTLDAYVLPTSEGSVW